MTINNWTTKDIPDLRGIIIIVTGGNSGLGLASVKAYAEKGAEVIMACRSVLRGKEARKLLLKELPKAKVKVMELDLSNFWSIRMFVTDFKKDYSQLDILLNNAGVMMTPYTQTKDGVELQQSTNYFGHYALTGLLLDLLIATPASRVVSVSSLAHRSAKLNFKNLLYEKGRGYSPYKAYSRSKLQNLLFTFELQRFFEKHKLDCKALVAHPGVSYTNLFTHAAPKWLRAIMRPAVKSFMQPAEMGALPQLRASVDPDVKGGDFFGPKGAMQMKGYPVKVKAAPHAYNKVAARKLWECSEKITGVMFEYTPVLKMDNTKKMVV
ncbi:MAG: SDR family NAD(P)-dependent oxidoreductase [Paludibacteraceae bacterium]|nr:SDR family NAD(P)-dependent oxidoreductase [Paludibacteraceae bacterium]